MKKHKFLKKSYSVSSTYLNPKIDVWERDKSRGSNGDGQNKGGKWLVILASSVSSGCEELVEAQEKARCAKSNLGRDTSKLGSGIVVTPFTASTSSGTVILFNVNGMVMIKIVQYENETFF